MKIMDTIPDEILLLIMDYMGAMGRIRGRRVCKRWRDIWASFRARDGLFKCVEKGPKYHDLEFYFGGHVFSVRARVADMRTDEIMEMIEFAASYGPKAPLFGPSLCVLRGGYRGHYGVDLSGVNLCFGMGGFVLMKFDDAAHHIFIEKRLEIEEHRYHILSILITLLALKIKGRPLVKFEALETPRRAHLKATEGLDMASIVSWAQGKRRVWTKKRYI